MFEIYSKDDGSSLYIANSLFGLNQCLDTLERKGIGASYVPLIPKIDNAERIASIPRWTEQ